MLTSNAPAVALFCGFCVCKASYTSGWRLMDATKAAVIPACVHWEITVNTSVVFTVLHQHTHFVANTGVCTAVQQSWNYVKMAFFAGKHESSESCVLYGRRVCSMHMHMLSACLWVWLTDCCRSGSAFELRSSSTIAELPLSQHNMRADSPPCMTDNHMTHTAGQHMVVHWSSIKSSHRTALTISMWFGLAPASSSSLARTTFPFLTAISRGVWPSCG